MDNLVAGGAGFLGSHILSELLNNGEKVICLDNFSTGTINNLKDWLNHPNLKIIDHDIINPIDIKAHKVWHFACPASPKIYQKDPIKTAKINFIGTLNLLEIARNSNAKFLLASSSEIYGDSRETSQNESNNGILKTNSIRSCYQEGKRIAETLCFDYSRFYRLDIKVARIFNTYGPNMAKDDGRVISNFINQGLNNRDISIYGNGNQSRCFCYVDDLIKGLIKFMHFSTKEPINFGNPSEEFTIKELAKMIRLKTNYSLSFKYSSLPYDDPVMRKPDIEKAKSLLNWDPRVDIDKGLNKTIKYFKKINA